MIAGFCVEEGKLEKSFETVFRKIFPEAHAAGAVVAQGHAGVNGTLVEEDHDLANELGRDLIGKPIYIA